MCMAMGLSGRSKLKSSMSPDSAISAADVWRVRSIEEGNRFSAESVASQYDSTSGYRQIQRWFILPTQLRHFLAMRAKFVRLITHRRALRQFGRLHSQKLLIVIMCTESAVEQSENVAIESSHTSSCTRCDEEIKPSPAVPYKNIRWATLCRLCSTHALLDV